MSFGRDLQNYVSLFFSKIKNSFSQSANFSLTPPLPQKIFLLPVIADTCELCLGPSTILHLINDINLLHVKTRVAPFKSTSIQRLELCAATLLAVQVIAAVKVVAKLVASTY